MHYVYKLVDPRDSEVRYIGMTHDPHMRYLHHIQGKEGTQLKRDWIRELIEAGLKPRMDIIESHEDREVIQQREKHWILTYQRCRAKLLNAQRGFLFPAQHTKLLDHILAYYDNGKVLEKVRCGLEALKPVSIEKRGRYNIQELFNRLPITIQQVSALLNIPEYAVIRFASGEEIGISRARLWSAFFSWIYQIPIPLTSISGISIKEENEARKQRTYADHPSF